MFTMRRRFAVIGAVALGLAGAVMLAIVPSEPSQAASTASATFIVPADDGYGVAECASMTQRGSNFFNSDRQRA